MKENDPVSRRCINKAILINLLQQNNRDYVTPLIIKHYFDAHGYDMKVEYGENSDDNV